MEITLFLFFQTRISSVFCVIITLESVKSVPEKKSLALYTTACVTACQRFYLLN